MSNNRRINQTRHPNFEAQQRRNSCGAACAVMVLDAIQVNHPAQLPLFELIKAFPTRDNGPNPETWESSPDGLTDILNRYGRPDHVFKLYANKRQNDISRRIVWTRITYKTPCIVLIESGVHWVVVYDFDFIAGATIPRRFREVRTQDILKFYYLNPFMDVASETVVDYNDWIFNIQTPEDTGLWQDDFIAICDPDPSRRKNTKKTSMPIKKILAIPSKKDGPFKKPEIQPPATSSPTSGKKPEMFKPKKAVSTEPPIKRIKTPGPDKGLIDILTAKTYSMWYMKGKDFYKPDKFTRTMKKFKPGEPVLVMEINKNDFWYLVPFIEPGNMVGGIMRMDAKTAKFQEATFMVKPKKSYSFKRFTESQITGILIKKFGSKKAVLENHVDPILVWQRCEQSYTPFMPFYRVKMGNRTAYIRMDGEVFSKLTERK